MILLDALANATNLTASESQVANYLLDHPDAVNTMTVSEIGAAALTSKPTVLRLCKKMGFSGFKPFRQQLMVELLTQNHVQAQLQARAINQETPLSELGANVTAIYAHVYKQVQQLLDQQALQRTVNLLSHATTVDLYATGIAGACAEAGAFKLRTVGLNATLQTNVNEHYVAANRNVPHRVALLISFTGGNPMVLEAARYLKQAGVYLIGIGGQVSTALRDNTDAYLTVPSTAPQLNMEVIESAAAVNYLLDILMAALTVARFPQVLKTSVSLVERREKHQQHLNP